LSFGCRIPAGHRLDADRAGDLTSYLLARFDRAFFWQAFAYDGDSQVEVLKDVVQLGWHYLRGDGEVKQEHNWRGKSKSFLSISMNEDEVKFAAE
jgi:hypothetical protein